MWKSVIFFLAILDQSWALPQDQIFDPKSRVMTLQQVLASVKNVEAQHAKKYNFLENQQGNDDVSDGRILTVPIQARSEDLPQIERLSLEEERSQNEQAWQIFDASAIERQNRDNPESPQKLDIRAPDASGFREAALVTSTASAVLTLSPGSRLYGQPGETVQVEFLLTNLGPDQYFTVSAKEDGSTEQQSGDHVIFPTGSFLSSLSEYKPWVRRNETTTLVITLKVPEDATLFSLVTLTLEVQPYGSTASGRLIKILNTGVGADLDLTGHIQRSIRISN